jgi:hypothetical protein
LPAQPRLNNILLAVVVVAVAAVTAERLWLAQGLPLWLDETWTAMIAGQPTWSAFWREAWLDCNAPFYYVVMWLWERVAGQSNLALRAPSLIFVTLAGLLPAFWRAPGMSRATALTWAALLCLWWPGISVSLEARAYGLLLLVSVAQTIAYARVLDRPDLNRALLWAGLASLAILTHYYALYLAAVQGVLLLALRRPWRTWPAALLFLPAFGWLAMHLPRLADYARPEVAWYEPVSLGTISSYVTYITGPDWRLFPALVAMIVVASVLWKRPRPSTLWIVVGASVAALLLALAIGVMKPSLTPRYLIPMIPALLLGLALAVHRSPLAGIALVALFLGATLTPEAHWKKLQERAAYGYEPHSAWLMAARPDHLVFAWDHPAAQILDEGSLARLGGFFFHRAGVNIETKGLILRRTDDPNVRLPQAAEGERPAFIWIYNVARKTAAREHPPREIAGWRCMSTRDGPIGIAACAPRHLWDSPAGTGE